MKVQDLIKWLSKFNPDDEVKVNIYQHTLIVSRRRKWRNGRPVVIAQLDVNRKISKIDEVFCEFCHKKVKLQDSYELHYYTNDYTAHFCSLECFQKWVWETFLRYKVKVKATLEVR